MIKVTNIELKWAGNARQDPATRTELMLQIEAGDDIHQLDLHLPPDMFERLLQEVDAFAEFTPHMTEQLDAEQLLFKTEAELRQLCTTYNGESSHQCQLLQAQVSILRDLLHLETRNLAHYKKHTSGTCKCGCNGGR